MKEKIENSLKNSKNCDEFIRSAQVMIKDFKKSFSIMSKYFNCDDLEKKDPGYKECQDVNLNKDSIDKADKALNAKKDLDTEDIKELQEIEFIKEMISISPEDALNGCTVDKGIVIDCNEGSYKFTGSNNLKVINDTMKKKYLPTSNPTNIKKTNSISK